MFCIFVETKTNYKSGGVKSATNQNKNGRNQNFNRTNRCCIIRS